MKECHQIRRLDAAYRPASEPPSWHKVETPVEGEITCAEQIPNVAVPIYLEPYPTPEGYILASSACEKQIVADHPEHGKVILGTFSRKYEVFSNRDIFDQVMEAFAANNLPARLVFALTMKDLAMVSYSFELANASEFMAGGRPHKMYNCFWSSHDGKNGLNACGTSVNCLCWNTHRMMVKGPKEVFDFVFYHDKRGKEMFQELPRLIEATLVHASAYSKLADQMANKTLNTNQAHAIAMELLAKGASEISGKTVNAAAELARLFKKGIGNNGDDLFDLVNAATEYWTHGEGSGKSVSAAKKLFNSEFGTAADNKVDFIQRLQNKDGDLISDDELNQIIAAGDKLLLEHA